VILLIRFPALLDILVIEGAIITADAIGCPNCDQLGKQGNCTSPKKRRR
jgi:hypothetical protein